MVEESDQTFFKIDGLNEKFCINRKGLLWNTFLKQPIYPIFYNNELAVSFYINSKNTYISLKKLYLMAFSPMDVKLDDYLNRLEVITFDENQKTLSSKNLFWRTPKGGIESVKYKGFYCIPGNPNLLVSKDFVFKNANNNFNLKISEDTVDTYPTVSNEYKMGFELPFQTRSVHRLIMFAFSPVLCDKSKIFVNHKNGIKNDFRIDNLEWVSYQENSIHAINAGLRGDNIPVVCVNLLTKKKFYFPSLQTAAKETGVHAWEISKGISSFENNKEITTKPWLFLKKNTPIPRLNYSLIKEAKPKKYTFFKLTEIKTQKDFFVKGKDNLMDYLKTKQINCASSNDGCIIKEHVVKSIEPWDIPIEIRKSFTSKYLGGKVQKPIRVTDLTNGSVITYKSTDEFATLVGAKRKTIQRRALFNNGIWHNFKIEYLSLS